MPVMILNVKVTVSHLFCMSLAWDVKSHVAYVHMKRLR